MHRRRSGMHALTAQVASDQMQLPSGRVVEWQGVASVRCVAKLPDVSLTASPSGEIDAIDALGTPVHPDLMEAVHPPGRLRSCFDGSGELCVSRGKTKHEPFMKTINTISYPPGKGLLVRANTIHCVRVTQIPLVPLTCAGCVLPTQSAVAAVSGWVFTASTRAR